MRQKISILMVLLLVGLLLVGPASAASVIGHGSYTYHANDSGTYYTATYKWTAYKYTDYKVKQVLTCTYSTNGTPTEKLTAVADVLKAGSGKVKVVETFFDSTTGKSKCINYYHIKYGSAVRFYFTEKFKTLYLKDHICVG